MEDLSKINEENKKLQIVYFIGIGGIGMSAVARYFQSKGIKVSGYDKTETTLTKELIASGINVHYEENIELIPKDVQLVVYTPALPEDHQELLYYRQNGYRILKRSEVLQSITESSFNICIAGTHGKTTVTTMIAHMLRDSGYGCNAFLGGISVNYGTNFWSHERNVCVIEADEYDRSFLKLSPDIAIITSMDADHLDVYGSAESVEQGFIDFSKKLKPQGLLISKLGLKRENELNRSRHIIYSLQDENADVYATNIRMINGGYGFNVILKENRLENLRLNMGGFHNVENIIAAIAAASSLEIENDKIKAAVESFRGVKRRFEYIVMNEKIIFIDDYAHHPEELRALITGAKALFKPKNCTVIFQPHLYSRTRDQAEGFAQVLDLAEEVFLLPIYPARELPIKGVGSQMIADKMNGQKAVVCTKEETLAFIGERMIPKGGKDLQLLITAGAGDIDMMVEPIKKIIEKKLVS